MGTSSEGDDTTELIERFRSELRLQGIELDSGAEDELFSIAMQLARQDNLGKIILAIREAIPRYVLLAAQRADSQRRALDLDPAETYLMSREDLQTVFARCIFCEGPHAAQARSRLVR